MKRNKYFIPIFLFCLPAFSEGVKKGEIKKEDEIISTKERFSIGILIDTQ